MELQEEKVLEAECCNYANYIKSSGIGVGMTGKIEVHEGLWFMGSHG